MPSKLRDVRPQTGFSTIYETGKSPRLCDGDSVQSYSSSSKIVIRSSRSRSSSPPVGVLEISENPAPWVCGRVKLRQVNKILHYWSPFSGDQHQLNSSYSVPSNLSHFHLPASQSKNLQIARNPMPIINEAMRSNEFATFLSKSDDNLNKQDTTTTQKNSFPALNKSSSRRTIDSFFVENWSEPRMVWFPKNPTSHGLGLELVGGSKLYGRSRSGLLVSKIMKDSYAASSDCVQVGDRILQVNGQDVTEMSHSDAVKLIVNSNPPVKLFVMRMKPLDSMLESQDLVPLSPEESESEEFMEGAAPIQQRIKQLAAGGLNNIEKQQNESSKKKNQSMKKKRKKTQLEHAPHLAVSSLVRTKMKVMEWQEKILRTKMAQDLEKLSGDPQEMDKLVDKYMSFLDDNEREQLKSQQISLMVPKINVGFSSQSAASSEIDDDEEEDNSDEEEYIDGPLTQNQANKQMKRLMRKYGELEGRIFVIEIPITVFAQLQGHSANVQLGLGLTGNRDFNKMNCFVSCIKPESIAEKDGRVHVGDQLLEVNGQVLYGRSHLNAAPLIRCCYMDAIGGTGGIFRRTKVKSLRLVVQRNENNFDEMAVDYYQGSYQGPRGSVDTELFSLVDDEIAIKSPVKQRLSRSSNSGGGRLAYENIYACSLIRGSQGFGFAIMEGSFTNEPGIYVKQVISDGPAAKVCPRLLTPVIR
ncbi:hypothetical protein Ciccas_003554 [Cichlidogyrus casuarinus]|uniref:PDZ domain-containing protein n=1 Tax=Cichlidogyrus casuarinus TaxID=1844966 RepID=A0ABD2QE09_9PLAT